jgi:hypothetical protein
VRAKIDAEFKEGNLEVLSCSIKGSKFPEQEIVIISHLCHPIPSANDNGSGAAGLLELARAFKYLIKNKVIESPKRTLRFIWVPEFNGTVPWMKTHENRVKKTLACINLDMIGEHPQKLGQPFEVYLTPRSTPSFLNDVTTSFVKLIADHPKGIATNGTKNPMSYRFRSYDGGSDHVLFIDSYFGVPSLMLGHNDPNWHSNVDTVEYCDSTELKRVIAVALSISYVISALDKDLIKIFWPIMHQGIFKRIGVLVRLLDELTLDKPTENTGEADLGINSYILGQALLNASFQYELDLLETLKLLDHSPETLNIIEMAKKELSELEYYHKSSWKDKYKLSEEKIRNQELLLKETYERDFLGPLYVKDVFQLAKYEDFETFLAKLKYEYLGPVNEIFNLIGKGFNLLTIAAYLSLEYESIIHPKTLQTLLNRLEKENLIRKK